MSCYNEKTLRKSVHWERHPSPLIDIDRDEKDWADRQKGDGLDHGNLSFLVLYHEGEFAWSRSEKTTGQRFPFL